MERTEIKGRITVRKAVQSAMSKLGSIGVRLKDIYPMVNDLRGETPDVEVRSVIYRNSEFIRTEQKGVWTFNCGESTGTLIQGDGRIMKEISDNYAEIIITDHPWKVDGKLYSSGNNKGFVDDYKDTCFNYTLEDFKQKSRVLKENGILVEFMPEMQGDNYKMHMNLLNLAEQTGFKLFTTIDYIREGESVNTGRKQKGTGTLYIFTKGEPPLIRPNNMAIKQKIFFPIANSNPFATYGEILEKIIELGIEDFPRDFIETKIKPTEVSWKRFSSQLANLIKSTDTDVVFKEEYCMRGLRYMLPAIFSISKEKKEHQAQKPKSLLKKLLHAVSLPGQIIIDQFGGSGIIAKALGEIKRKREIIIYEILDKYIFGDKDNIGMIKRLKAENNQDTFYFKDRICL